MQETWVQYLGQEYSLEKKMATRSLQYSCLGKPIDRGAWRATVHRVRKVSDSTYQLNNNNCPAPSK